MKKVAFIDEVHPVLNEKLTDFGFECVDMTTLSKEEIEKNTKRTEGLKELFESEKK